jgi:tripartite-type tricarboxylate transporter receptor subunit TctC
MKSQLSRRTLLLGAPIVLAAASYPDQPIRIVVPFTPGGAVDIVGRLTAKYLTEELGQNVFVDNRSGAGGSIGTNYVAKSPADGATLLLHTASSAVLNGLLYPHLPYDPRRSFVAITEIAAAPTLVVISAQVPATDVQQFVALVRQKPGQYKFGSAGVGSSVHLDGQLFATRMGLQMTHVPYRGEGDAIRDLIAGRTQMETGVVSAFLPFIQAGQLRALCVNDTRRLALLPDVPTSSEAGVPDYVLPNWYALVGPAGLPDEIVQRIYHATTKILQIPEMHARLAALGLDVVGSSPAEIAAYWDSQFAFWEPFVKASGIKLQD